MLRLLSLLFMCVSLLVGCKGKIEIFQDQGEPPVDAGMRHTEVKVIETAQEKLIELYRGDNWHLVQSFPSGYLELTHRANPQSTSASVALPLHVRKNSYPMWAIESHAGDFYLVLYDVVKNSPSGRSLAGSNESLSVYRLTKGGELYLLADDISLGGIDTQIYGASRGGGIDICGDNKCFSIENDSNVNSWAIDFLSEEEFIEVSFSETYAAAIVRKKYDDRLHGRLADKYSNYSLVVFDESGLLHRTEMGKKIPYDLRLHGSSVIYREASSIEDYANMFLIDFFKMRFHGIQDYGSNNLEGRVAWSQVYYLNGLISLLDGVGPNLGDSARAYFLERVRGELSLIANLCVLDYPGLEVKRYSIDRENLLFALHLGRVLDLLGRADSLQSKDQHIHACKESIKHELRSLKRTVEEIYRVSTPEGSEMVMRYKYGYPFWADGVNVPFNYISGYISGLLSFKKDKSDIDAAVRLSWPLLSEDLTSEYPELWRYWQGSGDKGWAASDRISLNTVKYKGNRGSLAHVTYRTMDAYALTTIYRMDEGRVPSELIRHFRALVKNGYLLPSLNEAFANSDEGPVIMNPMVVNRFARSAHVYELQSQIWALNQLTRESANAQ